MAQQEVHVYEECGFRRTMEDKRLIDKDLMKDGRVALYAVFDGHAGGHVSEYLETHYVDVLRKCIVEFGLENAEKALQESFNRCDADMEAGLEHLGRGTARYVGALLIVAEPTAASARTSARVERLARGLGLRVPGVVVHKAASPEAVEKVRPHLDGLEGFAVLPNL